MALQLTTEEVKLLLNFTQGKLDQKSVKEWVRVRETELLELLEWKKLSGQVDGKKAAAVHHLHGYGDIEDFRDEIDHDEAETNDDSLKVLLSAMQDLDSPDGANTSGTRGCARDPGRDGS